MAQFARHYRSFAEFEREELFRPEGFVQTLDDFHNPIHVEEGDLWDRADEEEEE